MNFRKKYRGIPLFIIIISTLIIGGALAQSVNWTLNTDFTYTPEAPAESTYTETFTIQTDTPYINAEANLTGLGTTGDPLYYFITISNVHPTLNLDSGWTVTMTLTNGAESHTDTATCGVTLVAQIGSYPGILDGTITPTTQGTWTITIQLTNLNWV